MYPGPPPPRSPLPIDEEIDDEQPPSASHTTYFPRNYQLLSSSRYPTGPAYRIPIRHIGKHDVIFLRDIQRILPNVTALRIDNEFLHSMESDDGFELEPTRWEAIDGRVIEGYEPADERTDLLRGLLRQATDLVVQLRALSQELRHHRGGSEPAPVRSFRLLEDLMRSIGEEPPSGGGASTSRGVATSTYPDGLPSYPTSSSSGAATSSSLPPSYAGTAATSINPPSYPTSTSSAIVTAPPLSTTPSVTSTVHPPDYAAATTTPIGQQPILQVHEALASPVSPTSSVVQPPTILQTESTGGTIASTSEPPSYAP
ncbi:hypothetical protein SmJEL517_g04361 [Synchytrium microbalum]|uniref:Uncharacterized protein n=1 Tax=Synchytrium microbalum TaxID=1806994 RepID=A0A507C4S4_9FUNG|nr:uncharacterized protein SmJEL517_g04361 [Synchytrium microbalum]TPX32533.1 hypothetical protein SmJEL517_g04361 [Synchytrium microbalum]